MPFVPVPKDLSKVRVKVLLGLTKRQLICFTIAAAVGIPTYLFTRGVIGGDAAVILMIGLMLPWFFFAMFEKDGLSAEKTLRNFLRAKFFWPATRPYKTRNLYTTIMKEATPVVKKTNRAGKAPRRR